MKLEHTYLYITFILLSLFISSCDNAAVVDVIPVGYSSIVYSDVEPVYEVDFAGGTELGISISGTFSGQDMFLVKMNSNDSIVDSLNSGYVTSGNINRSLLTTETNVLSSVERILPLKRDHIASMEFMTQYHPEEDSGLIVPSRSIFPEKEASIVPAAGATKLFYVEDVNGVFVEIEATLKIQGEYSNIWVSGASFDDTSTDITDNKLTTAQLTNLAVKFNGTSGANFEDGIYELVTNVFGYEYGGGDLEDLVEWIQMSI